MIKRRIPLAWRQIARSKGRFIVAISGIAFADLLIFMQLGFQSALLDSNTRLHKSLKTDLVLVSSQAQYIGAINTFPRQRLFQATNLPAVKSAAPLYVRLGVWKNPQSQLKSSILVIGFNPASSALNLPEVKQNLNQIKYPYTLLFDRGSVPTYQPIVDRIARGEVITTELQGRKIAIEGLYKIGLSFTSEASVITSDQNFLRLFSSQSAGQVNVGLINLKPNSDVKATAELLRSQLQDDVKIFTLQEFIDFERKYWQEGSPIGFIFSLGVFLGFVVGVIVVYQILYSDVNDNLSEYATLKAMGYSNFYLLSVVFQQAVILAIFGYFPGFLASAGLYGLISGVTNLPLLMTVQRFLQILTLTIVMCVISGTIAIQKLRSADPADIF